ncbi:MAG: formate hydrogenlyase [Nitrospirae bacterium]|nr:formate hydrogenlyase [Nitrospirota bacterium]MBI3391805.1 formate hydrogenlyase [Nitrospirota bacterium]
MSPVFLAQVIDLLSALVLLLGFGLLAQRRIYALLHLFAWQGLFLAANTAIVAYGAGVRHLYFSALMTLAMKVALIPYILHVLIRRMKIERDVETMVNVPLTLLIGIALVVLSYNVMSPIQEFSTLMTRSTLAIALATVMLGLLMMITRRHAVAQVIGFLAMENGLFFAATSATYGMPMVVELGVALDILIAALIFGVFFFQIRTTFESLDLSKMARLKEDVGE